MGESMRNTTIVNISVLIFMVIGLLAENANLSMTLMILGFSEIILSTLTVEIAKAIKESKK